MNKAILIMEMPRSCGTCKLQFYGSCYAIAQNSYNGKRIRGKRNHRQSWCPLKPIPVRHGRGSGRHELMKEILGEEE